MNTTRVSNSLDPDQARRFVGSDLGPNCLHMLQTGTTSRQRAIGIFIVLSTVKAFPEFRE